MRWKILKGTTKSLGRKDSLDKFYTKSEVAKQLIQEVDLSVYDVVIEPSAGNGSFSNQIENCVALDLEPRGEKIIKQDFFSYIGQLNKKILVIGNPPFGEQGNLAIKFFNHAATFANTIAFILPKSFKKISIQNKLDLSFYLKKEVPLKDNSFLLMGEDYDVPCIFQIWERGKEKREKVSLPTKSKILQFVKTKEEADFRIQRVGGNAGKAFLDKNGALSSNYYVKNISNIPIETLIKEINSLSYWSLEDTVGPKSLPKGELIYLLEKKTYVDFSIDL